MEKKNEQQSAASNVPAPIESEKPTDVMIVSDGELPASGGASVVSADESVPPAAPPPVMEFDAAVGDESMRGGYASVKGREIRDNKLIWSVVAVMSALCIVVAVCASMLTAFFMQRGDSPAVIKTNGKVQQNISAVVSARANTVVEVACGSGNDTLRGSGIIMKRDAGKIYILTNAHILNQYVLNSFKPSVRFYGEDAFFQADVYGYNSRYDIAVLTIVHHTDYTIYDIDGSEFFSPDVEYKDGDYLVSIGNAMGYGISYYDGIVSRSYELLECDELFVNSGEKKTVPVMRTTAVINAGMSGGAVYDMHGNLVGMGTYRLSNAVAVDKEGSSNTDVENTGFAVPVCIIYPVYKAIMAFGGSGGKVDVSNIRYAHSTESAVGRLLLPYGYICEYRNGNLIVTSLDAGTPDKRVYVGDVITKINGKAVNADICRTAGLLLGYIEGGSGDTLKLTVSHNSATITLSYNSYRYVA